MNVLILTDFSKVAENAGKYALQFLQNVPANFHLLNIENFNSATSEQNYMEARKDIAIEKLRRRIEELQKMTTNKDHSFQAFFSKDNLVTATRSYVQEKKIDLIVMGAAGKDRQKKAILGNHTYEVIRKVRCNLLAVAEGSVYKEPEKIVLPMDYSASLNEKVFRFFDSPGIVKKTSITVLEIQDKNSALVPAGLPGKEVFGKFNSSDVSFLEVKDKALFSENLLLDVQRRFDMIVMLGKNLSMCDRLLHTKYGICTAIYNKLPILVLHG